MTGSLVFANQFMRDLKYGYNLALFLFSVYDIEKQERPDWVACAYIST